jgi:hypothetical protein
MATQMNDDGTVSDAVTKENQKGYSNYEREQMRAQKEMETKDAKTKEKYSKIMEAGMSLLGRPLPDSQKKAKGGSVKSASARADGCAIRGKTKA